MVLSQSLAFACGGLSLFIFGIINLNSILKNITYNDFFRNFIRKISNHPLKSFLFGLIFTAIIQSSGASSVLTLGLLGAGMMDAVNALSIFIGSNIGTCVKSFMTVIPSFNMYAAFAMIFASLVMLIFHSKITQLSSKILFSFSLFLFGMFLVKFGFKNINLSNLGWFKFIVNHSWLGFFCAMLITMTVQSSSVAIGIFQVLGSAMSGTKILPFVFGVNAGAIMVPILAIMSKKSTAPEKRIVLIRVFMKISVSFLFMLFYPFGISWLFGKFFNMIGEGLRIAFTHLILNSVMALIFLPLSKVFCKLSELIIVDVAVKEEKVMEEKKQQ